MAEKSHLPARDGLAEAFSRAGILRRGGFGGRGEASENLNEATKATKPRHPRRGGDDDADFDREA